MQSQGCRTARYYTIWTEYEYRRPNVNKSVCFKNNSDTFKKKKILNLKLFKEKKKLFNSTNIVKIPDTLKIYNIS